MMVTRGALAVVLTLSLLATPIAIEAQQPTRVPRIGMLGPSSPERPETRAILDAFRQALRELGYVEGQSIIVEYRWVEGRLERLADLATELVRLKVDLIVAGTTPLARAARQATTTIPIVAWALADPVNDGLAASLARPGGNVTGLTSLGTELVVKRLQMLKEALPEVSRVAALWHPGAFPEGTMQHMVKEAEAAARTLGVQLQLVGAGAPNDIDGAFSAMTRGHVEALITFPDLMFFQERRRIVDLAAKHRLPAMHNAREFVDVGGLMAYGTSIPDLARRAATYVDKILKGAKPGDLPIEQPTKFEFVINMKTARALGLTIPPTLLLRADQVIE